MTDLLPADHPLRLELNDEVHARPPEQLRAPVRVAYMALLSPGSAREVEREAVAALAARFGRPGPAAGSNHFSADLGPFRLKWERHTEFARYKVIVPCDPVAPFAGPTLELLPQGWLAGLPGQLLAAVDAAILPEKEGDLDLEALAARFFAGNTLVGSAIGDQVAVALTDLRIHADRFSRLLIVDRGMTSRQAGRMLQRLLEMESYRMLALLALPLARALAPTLDEAEGELTEIAEALAVAREADEPVLLDRLTRLQAEIDRRAAASHYRFAAAAAYDELVQRRIAELREQRMAGLQTFGEFTQRRLAPAMQTCRAVAARQASLATRAARTTQLLSTRVDVTRERQNQAVLESMNRRAKLQLRLQQTVEGLSVAAITYYIVGLISYLAKGFASLGLPADPDLLAALSIPIVAVLVAVGVHRIRRVVNRRRHP